MLRAPDTGFKRFVRFRSLPLRPLRPAVAFRPFFFVFIVIKIFVGGGGGRGARGATYPDALHVLARPLLRQRLPRVDLADVELEVVLDVGGVRAVGALERLDGQVRGQVPLQVPVAGEAAAAGGALEVGQARAAAAAPDAPDAAQGRVHRRRRRSCRRRCHRHGRLQAQDTRQPLAPLRSCAALPTPSSSCTYLPPPASPTLASRGTLRPPAAPAGIRLQALL